MEFIFIRIFESDLTLIEKWLVQPHVKKWFDKSVWVKEISENLHSDWVWQFRADLNSTPAGFVQCYDTAKAPQGSWSTQPPGTLGIDFFLGEPSLLGNGNGVKLVNDFVEYLECSFNPRRIIADPEMENTRSQNTLKSCGFQADHNSDLFIKDFRE
ncbi:MAG: GNAT family N-acetyltransferase [SAR324 cluster bacterium]|nr:GNAT family N-acetyltransferase [SAR324 cluster bacterium]